MTRFAFVAPLPYSPTPQSQLLPSTNVSGLAPTLSRHCVFIGRDVGRTVADGLRFVGLEFNPEQVDDLVCEHRGEEDLCDRSAEGLVESGLEVKHELAGR